jgi:hypothetical protein
MEKIPNGAAQPSLLAVAKKIVFFLYRRDAMHADIIVLIVKFENSK